jgi:hypothetical protein
MKNDEFECIVCGYEYESVVLIGGHVPVCPVCCKTSLCETMNLLAKSTQLARKLPYCL